MRNIDIPDFDDALANDRDGSFHTAVEGHLTQALAAHQTLMQRGMAPDDFARAKQIETALSKSLDVIRFSQKLPQSK